MLKDIELHGHRGGRGLWPENSIYGFIKAIELGVDVIELDVVVTGEDEILVSHDPFFNKIFCLDPKGQEIVNENDYTIFKMPFSEIEKFDCGIKHHPNFPEQEKVSLGKPLLQELIYEVDKKCEELNIEAIKFNIEIKSEARWYGNHQPEKAEDYVQLILNEIGQLAIERFTLQSFDRNILKSLFDKAPDIRLSYLLKGKELTASTIDSLDFRIYAFSPEYKLLREELVEGYQSKGIKVIPWTVNEKEDMLRLASWGIDGIITDYPNRWIEMVNEKC